MSQTATRIVRNPEVMGGEPVIEGTRVTVLRIHALVHERELPPAEVASMHDLDVEAVQTALNYYEANPDVVEEVEAWREKVKRRSLEGDATTLDEMGREHEEDSGGASTPD